MPALIAAHPADVRGTSAALRYAAARLLPVAVGVYAVLAGAGLLLTGAFSGSALMSQDRRLSSGFAERRTPTLSMLTQIGSLLSDTFTVIGVTAVIMVVLRVALHRWREALTILTAVVGELWIFLGVTATVHRERPDVARLDPAPPTSSFPSGHTGAAVALYVGLALVLFSLVRRGDITSRGGEVAVAVGAAALCCIPVVVGLSRLYRGMHYLTDVVAGAVAGGLWAAAVVLVLLRLGPGRPGARPGARPRPWWRAGARRGVRSG